MSTGRPGMASARTTAPPSLDFDSAPAVAGGAVLCQ
jgi:hypothetical protein